MRASTIHAFFETAARDPAGRAVRYRAGPARWTSLSWADYAKEVRKVARGLVALGIGPGDRVAICGPNRLEWLLADFGSRRRCDPGALLSHAPRRSGRLR